MKLVVGLGNPGKQYAETRHNIGWMVLDRIADRAGKAGRGRERDASSVIEIRAGGLEVALAKPQTYMNESGVAVRRLLQSYHVPLVDLLVIADDFALPFGKLRFREAGSHGGHNGLRSIIADLNTEKYSRLRIGIGEPGRGAVDHVLSRFSDDERARMPILLDAAAEAVEAWLRQGTSRAANRFNKWELQAPGATTAGADAADTAPKAGEVGGPADANGVRRTKTGWRKLLPGDGDHEHGEERKGGGRR